MALGGASGTGPLRGGGIEGALVHVLHGHLLLLLWMLLLVLLLSVLSWVSGRWCSLRKTVNSTVGTTFELLLASQQAGVQFHIFFYSGSQIQQPL